MKTTTKRGLGAKEKVTIASMVSEIVARRKRVTVEEVEQELKGTKYKPKAAYGVLLKLAKVGFVVKREDGTYESINTMPAAQDKIVSRFLMSHRKGGRDDRDSGASVAA